MHWFPAQGHDSLRAAGGQLERTHFMQSGHNCARGQPIFALGQYLRFWINLVGNCTLASAGRSRAKKAQNAAFRGSTITH